MNRSVFVFHKKNFYCQLQHLYGVARHVEAISLVALREPHRERDRILKRSYSISNRRNERQVPHAKQENSQSICLLPPLQRILKAAETRWR
jgi:hypothetical protein